MMNARDLFDLSHTDHAELFNDVNFGWEVIPLIEEYVEYALRDPHTGAQVSEKAVIGEQVSIGKGTVVEAGAIIQGPAVIGENCVIRSGAYIRQNVIVGDSCMIGNSSELKNCLLFDEVAAPHFNYIGDSVLGYKVHLGAGVILSNIKTPPSEVKIVTLEETINTGLEKFGALIGDFTEVGAHSVLNPGSVIGQHCLLYPSTLFRGVLSHHSILKVRQEQEIVIKRGHHES